MSAKPNRQLEAFEHGRDGLAALGFQHVGWFRLDDFDETHVSAWRHPTRFAIAFVLFLPITSSVRLRIVRRFADGWILTSSTRLPDLSYAMPPHTYLQARRCSAAELWAWHLEAEQLFPARSAARFAAPPAREVYVEWSRRVARHHQSVWLWFLRYEPFGECWRILRRRGVSVRSQIDRGWATDPTVTFPDPDAANA